MSDQTHHRLMTLLEKCVGRPIIPGPKQTFDDLGMDSLDLLEFAYLCEAEFGLWMIEAESNWTTKTKVKDAFGDVGKWLARGLAVTP